MSNNPTYGKQFYYSGWLISDGFALLCQIIIAYRKSSAKLHFINTLHFEYILKTLSNLLKSKDKSNSIQNFKLFTTKQTKAKQKELEDAKLAYQNKLKLYGLLTGLQCF